MNDEQENVDAGSETSGEQAAEPSHEETAAETTDASQEQSDETPADAGGAAEQTEVAPNADESRTGFAEKGLHPGDQCTCPDGRTGTVHSFDAGLICIPNQG